jgi:hypothetical protein
MRLPSTCLLALEQVVVTEEADAADENAGNDKMLFPVELLPLPVFPIKTKRIIFIADQLNVSLKNLQTNFTMTPSKLSIVQ